MDGARLAPGCHMSNSNFCTPPGLLNIVRKLDPRGIGLDPCSNGRSWTGARTEWMGTEFGGTDGLIHSWRGHGLVFMNPPHSMSPHNIEPWIEKAWADCGFIETSGDQFVGLIPAKTDTAWFHDYAAKFPVKCFLRGRPKFWLNGESMPGPGKFASMLIYAGNKPDLFKTLFSPLGWIV